MTDDSTARRPLTSYEPVPVDGILLFLGELAGDGTLDIAITVHVKGKTISGMLSSRQKWRDHLKTSLGVTDWGKALGDGLIELIETGEAERVEEGAEQAPVQFLHMLEARFWDGAEDSPATAMRIRIASVDGWSLGSLGKS